MCLKGGMKQIKYEKPQILGATIQNLVALVTWHLG
jgi:hypothetical protein